jgi:RNA polymerase sigma factor (sigma-70 family)
LKGSPKYTEEELVVMLQRQEEAAFVYLYDNYAAALNGIIVTIIGNSPATGDVLQETLVKIWKQIHNYDPAKGRLFTWMHHIARNTAIDATRNKEWRKQKLNKSLTTEQVELTDDSLSSLVDKDLRKSVHRLKEEQKVLVEMSYFEGYTHNEIAEILQIPLGTVKTRIRAALSKLRQLITL